MTLTKAHIVEALAEQNGYRLYQLDAAVNKELMKDFLAKSGESLNEVDAAAVIIRELWGRLRETDKLRVVK